MSVGPKAIRAVSEYLALEQLAALKGECYCGEMFAMADAGRDHNCIRETLRISIGSALEGGPRQTCSRDQRVLVEATGLFTYPEPTPKKTPMVSTIS